MLVRVLTDIGGTKPVPLLARVVEERDNAYTIIYLSASEDKDHGRTIYRYESDTYDIDDDYVVEYLDDEEQAGFEPANTSDGWIKQVYDSDDDYEPSDEGVSLSGDDDEEDDEDDLEAEEEYVEDYDE
jgi:hypothetical protein